MRRVWTVCAAADPALHPPRPAPPRPGPAASPAGSQALSFFTPRWSHRSSVSPHQPVTLDTAAPLQHPGPASPAGSLLVSFV